MSKAISLPSSGVVLFHFWPSLCSQKVRLALAEKGVAYESRLINIGPSMENYEPAYVRINPGAVVPTLVVDGEVIVDSLHIMKEIDARFDGPKLLPDDDQQRNEVERLLDLQNNFPFREHAYGTQTGFLGFMVRASMELRKKKLLANKRKAPELAAAYDRRLADVAAWRRTITTPEEVAMLERRAEALLDELEAALSSSGGPFLTGPAYTLADLAWTIILARLVMQKRQRWWRDGRRPQVEAWFERMRQRPSFAQATVWERLNPVVMAPLVARFVLPRAAALLAACTVVGVSLWWVLR